MDAPRFELFPQQLSDVAASAGAREELAHRISGMLRTYRHFVVVRVMAREDGGELTKQLAEIIADAGPSGPGPLGERDKKVSANAVNLEPLKIKPGRRFRGTAYSRTNQPLGLHTDSTFEDRPHELVTFQFVRAAPGGGDTLMLPVKNVAEALGDGVRGVLGEATFPFGEKSFPLWERSGAPHMRYYRKQIELACENGARIGERERERWMNSMRCSPAKRSDTNFMPSQATPSTCTTPKCCTGAPASPLTATA
jgi:hypothetical protein